MISKSQIAIAKAAFGQLRTTSMHAYEAWAMTLKSQAALAAGFRGTPFEGTMKGILEAQEQAYAASLEAMNKAGDQYLSLLKVAEKDAG